MNHSFFDGMSLIHLGVGIAMGLFRIPFTVTLVVAVGWEVAEHVLKIHYPQWFMFPGENRPHRAVLPEAEVRRTNRERDD
jgi:hypothetical protein